MIHTRRLSNSEYSAIDAVNISTLKELWSRSPRHYQHRLLTPRADSPALAFGRLVHCAVLEPERLASEYAAEPEFGDLRTRDARARRDEWRAETAGKEPVSTAWLETAIKIARAIQAEPEAAHYLQSGRPEVVITWDDEETGIACKGRVDWRCRDAIVGLKTSRFIDTRKFASQAASFGYHLQWAFYHDGHARLESDLPLVEIVVETEPPFDVVVYDIPEEVLDEGRAAYRDALTRLRACRASGEWPGVSSGCRLTFALPKWATTHDDDDMTDLDFGGGKT